MAGTAQRRVAIINAFYPHYEVEKAALAPFGAEIEHVDTQGDPARVVEAVRGADAVMVRETPITAEAIEAMTRCKVIVRYGVGVDNIDLAAARRRRIYVANVPDYGSEEVSDHALALLMSVARRVTQRDRDVRRGVWGVGHRQPIRSFRGRTLGIVGFGRIGRAFHRKASALGFARTLVFDPYVKTPEPGIELVSIDDLCREADAISLHVPLTEETRRLINADRFSLMKPGVILVNTARGGVVDEQALVEALRSGRIAGAGIDVFEEEPVPLDHPLLGFENVVVTDHTGWYSEESVTELQTKATQEVVRVFRGERPHSWVNRWED